MSEVLEFISKQVLGMEWLNTLIGQVLSILKVDTETRLGESIQFFIYDTIKILFLLCLLIFVISFVQSYFPPERTKRILGKYKGIFANFMGALLGTLTPFCSCSSIPLFIGFTNAGVPIGVTFSFLISSPLVDIGAFILLSSIFGFKIAIIYVVVGILLAVVGGSIIDKLKLQGEIEKYIDSQSDNILKMPSLTIRNRIFYAKSQTISTFKKVFLYVLIGVLIGAVIHNWIPDTFIQSILGERNPFSVLLATIVGVPMYADIFGTIPIAEALYLKGVGIGTVLSFMMAITALSLPSIIMLRKAIKPKLLTIFVGIVTLGIVIIGYGFNFIQTMGLL